MDAELLQLIGQIAILISVVAALFIAAIGMGTIAAQFIESRMK